MRKPNLARELWIILCLPRPICVNNLHKAPLAVLYRAAGIATRERRRPEEQSEGRIRHGGRNDPGFVHIGDVLVMRRPLLDEPLCLSEGQNPLGMAIAEIIVEVDRRGAWELPGRRVEGRSANTAPGARIWTNDAMDWLGTARAASLRNPAPVGPILVQIFLPWQIRTWPPAGGPQRIHPEGSRRRPPRVL